MVYIEWVFFLAFYFQRSEKTPTTGNMYSNCESVADSEYCNSIWISCNQAFDQIAVITTTWWCGKARVGFKQPQNKTKLFFFLFREGSKWCFYQFKREEKKNNKKSSCTNLSQNCNALCDYNAEVNIVQAFCAYRRPTISSAVKWATHSKFLQNLQHYEMLVVHICVCIYFFFVIRQKAACLFHCTDFWARQLAIMYVCFCYVGKKNSKQYRDTYLFYFFLRTNENWIVVVERSETQ